MEIIIVVVLCIAIFSITVIDQHPTQPSFIITPITDEHIRHSNDGCLIMALLVIGVIFIVTISTL